MEVQDLIQKNNLTECIQCGVCSGCCPVFRSFKFNVRRIIRDIILSDKIILPENELWSCTTCSTCKIRCPRGLNPVDVIIYLRKLVLDDGHVLRSIRDTLESVRIHGNPWRRVQRERSEWLQNLTVKNISQGAELLYFVGCTPSYDPRIQNVARAMVECLNGAKINFGILGDEEVCCGNEVYGLGETALFNYLVDKNLKMFEQYCVEHVVTTCPHCYNAFKNKYGRINFEVHHHTQFIVDLIDKEKIRFRKEFKKNVAYHDPCFLGRVNSLYDEPRKIIESIPKVNFIELERCREKSLCCEGGGGRIWVDLPAYPIKRIERSSEIRIKEAVDAGVDILVTACPFCILMLEDAIKSTRSEGLIQVMDIVELVSKAI